MTDHSSRPAGARLPRSGSRTSCARRTTPARSCSTCPTSWRRRSGTGRDSSARSGSTSTARSSCAPTPCRARPETDADLTVTVKRVAGGLVSNWFLDHVGVGDVVEVTKPAGVFCPQDGAERPVLGFCGGSGITPVMSITKHVLATTRASGPPALRQPRPRLGDLRAALWPRWARHTRSGSRCGTTSTPTPDS